MGDRAAGDDGYRFLAVDAARTAAAYADHPGEPRRLRQPDRLPFIDGSAGFHLSPARALDPQAYASGGAGMVGSAEDFCACWKRCARGRAGTANRLGGGADHQPNRRSADAVLARARLRPGHHRAERSVAAQTPESVGSWRMGGTYGHSWFVDPARQLSVVAFTNTALEGMSGAFVGEICQAVYAATGVPSWA